jgi:hypothetical protein
MSLATVWLPAQRAASPHKLDPTNATTVADGKTLKLCAAQLAPRNLSIGRRSEDDLL